MKIISMNSICVDLYDGTDEIFPGGESLNFVMNWPNKEKDEIYLVGAIGNDKYGDVIMNKLNGNNIQLDGLHRVEGTTANNYNYIEINGERREKENAWNGGVYETFQLSVSDHEILKKADYVHTSINSPVFDQVLELKGKYNFQIVVDFNICRDMEKLERLAGKVDMFFISATDSILTRLKEWSKMYQGIYIGTCAAEGSICYYQGKEYRQEAIRTLEVVDTTGCGDSYQSGFVADYIHTNNIESAMYQGALSASETLKHYGAC